MHKSFYASGFLYHLASQQILLQKSNLEDDPLAPWSMFGGPSHRGEEAQETFRRIIYEQTKIRLETKSLFPVYDYFYNTINKIHYVFYAEVEKLYTFPLSKADIFSWFTFKLTNKLSFAERVKQDVIVSERVIIAQARGRETAIWPPS